MPTSVKRVMKDKVPHLRPTALSSKSEWLSDQL